jgi:hypothetical protein
MHHGATVAGTLKHQANDVQLALPAPKVKDAKDDGKKLL